ncbi:MAG: hypothetical protein HY284_01025 [Nitrospirae bacterium]|nr:hypothetical protein [Nitrospirota bacterium]
MKTPSQDEKDRIPESGGKEAVWVVLLLLICCAAVPLIAVGGVGLLAGLFTGTALWVLIGIGLLTVGGLLLSRKHRKETARSGRIDASEPTQQTDQSRRSG